MIKSSIAITLGYCGRIGMVRIVMLSIHPEYADSIFRGEKQVELRRIQPRLTKGDLIIVYASSPRKALLGVVEVESVSSLPLDQLWQQVSGISSLSHKDFVTYFSGVNSGYGIYLSNKYFFSKPIDLETLRQKWNGFCPPQCYRYIKPNEVELIESVTSFDFSSISKSSQINLSIA